MAKCIPEINFVYESVHKCTACISMSMDAAMRGLSQERKWHVFREFVSKLYLRVLLCLVSLWFALYICVCMPVCGPPKAFEVITITGPLPSSDMAVVPLEGL